MTPPAPPCLVSCRRRQSHHRYRSRSRCCHPHSRHRCCSCRGFRHCRRRCCQDLHFCPLLMSAAPVCTAAVAAIAAVATAAATAATVAAAAATNAVSVAVAAICWLIVACPCCCLCFRHYCLSPPLHCWLPTSLVTETIVATDVAETAAATMAERLDLSPR